MRVTHVHAGTLALALALISILGASSPSVGRAAVVWLTADVESEKTRTHVRLPLEWLAAVDDKEHSTITVEDVKIDCAELWTKYRDLPTGESREVRRGVSKEGEPYVINVVSQVPARDRAQGKVRILSRDKNGKEVDIGFPLDLPKLIQTLVSMVAEMFGHEPRQVSSEGVTYTGPSDLRKLAAYGPFTVIESSDSDSSYVRIWID